MARVGIYCSVGAHRKCPLRDCACRHHQVGLDAYLAELLAAEGLVTCDEYGRPCKPKGLGPHKRSAHGPPLECECGRSCGNAQGLAAHRRSCPIALAGAAGR